MQEARIELLQHMPVFGGIRADVLQYLLGLCPVQPVALVTVGHSAVGLAATPSPDQWV